MTPKEYIKNQIAGQKAGDERYRHTKEKKEQLDRFNIPSGTPVIELFAGKANDGRLTEVYKHMGCVVTSITSDMDASIDAHAEIGKGNKFGVVDMDPYGVPTKWLDASMKLLDDGNTWLAVTIGALNSPCGINRAKELLYLDYFGCTRPEMTDFMTKAIIVGLTNNKYIKFSEYFRISKIYRMVMEAQSFKVSEICAHQTKASEALPKLLSTQFDDCNAYISGKNILEIKKPHQSLIDRYKYDYNCKVFQLNEDIDRQLYDFSYNNVKFDVIDIDLHIDDKNRLDHVLQMLSPNGMLIINMPVSREVAERYYWNKTKINRDDYIHETVRALMHNSHIPRVESYRFLGEQQRMAFGSIHVPDWSAFNLRKNNPFSLC